MLTKITFVDFVSKDIRYHGPCWVKYHWKDEKVYWYREQEDIQITSILLLITSTKYLNDILQTYQFLVQEDNDFKDATPAVTHLQKRLTKYFGEKLKMEKINTIQGTLDFSLVLSVAKSLALKEDIMWAERNPPP